MRLSKKHTTAYVVMVTWPTAKFELYFYAHLDDAVACEAREKRLHPEAFVQVHKITQPLPEAKGGTSE